MLLDHSTPAPILLCWLLLLGAAAGAQPPDSAMQSREELRGTREPGTGSVGFRLGYYYNDDEGDGNPFLDEELTVVEPVLILDYDVTDRLSLWGQLSYDLVSSASIDRLSNYPEQSGASGDTYYGFDGGVRYEISPFRRIGGFASASFEYDYKSFGLGGDFSADVADNNATLGFALNGYLDRVDIIRFDGSEHGNDERLTLTGTFTWYQAIGRFTHGELGSTFSFQNGILETPYNGVVIEDSSLPINRALESPVRGREISEELPRSRYRGALFGRTRRLLRPGSAIELGGRFYSDSWGILSGSLEPRLFQSLMGEVLDLRLGYRFYAQTRADDFQDRFREKERFRTQDSDLAAFRSHGVDLKIAWQIIPGLLLDLSGGYVFRSDGLDRVLGSVGVSKEFAFSGGSLRGSKR